jgi:Predicted enzyme related to lactoylglutathione lyase
MSANAAAELYLIVIRVADVERAKQLYKTLGLAFSREQHGSGPEHFAAVLGGVVFEIYPQKHPLEQERGVRLGFRVESVDRTLESLVKFPLEVVVQPHDAAYGRRAVVRDPDGYILELSSLK